MSFYLNGYTSPLSNTTQIIPYQVLYKTPEASFSYIINYHHYNFFECDWGMNSYITNKSAELYLDSVIDQIDILK